MAFMVAGTPEVKRSEQQARLDGQMAALANKPVTDNPHPLGCSESRAFGRGWREIKEKLSDR